MVQPLPQAEVEVLQRAKPSQNFSFYPPLQNAFSFSLLLSPIKYRDSAILCYMIFGCPPQIVPNSHRILDAYELQTLLSKMS